MSEGVADFSTIMSIIERNKKAMENSARITSLSADMEYVESGEYANLNRLTPEILDEEERIEEDDMKLRLEQIQEQTFKHVEPLRPTSCKDLSVSSSQVTSDYTVKLQLEVTRLTAENQELRTNLDHLEKTVQEEHIKLKNFRDNEEARYKSELETMERERDSIQQQYNSLYAIHARSISATPTTGRLNNELAAVKQQMFDVQKQYSQVTAQLTQELEYERSNSSKVRKQLAEALCGRSDSILADLSNLENRINPQKPPSRSDSQKPPSRSVSNQPSRSDLNVSNIDPSRIYDNALHIKDMNRHDMHIPAQMNRICKIKSDRKMKRAKSNEKWASKLSRRRRASKA